MPVGTENEYNMLNSDVEDEFFYTDIGKKEMFSIRYDKVIIKSKTKVDAKALCKESIFLSAYNVDYWVIGTIDPEKTKLDDLLKLPGVVDATYGLEYGSGVLQYPRDKIFVTCKEGQLLERVLDVNGLNKNIVKIELFDPISELYMITLDIKLRDNLRICRNLYESGLCIADPAFVREMISYNAYYSDQWGLKNTGQNGGTSGIDINAEQAWTKTTGSSDIKVAVIDQGVDLTHPDLMYNLLPGFDAVPASINPGGANGSPYGDNAHGTACAGIIGALNNSTGVVGVAPNVRIIPIRIAYSVSGIYLAIYEEWIANGINYAWQTAQADILSCSWGMGSWNQLVATAITNAMSQGRLHNGTSLGCSVVAASGNNYSSSIGYPANYGNVIAVGAITRNGTRADFSSYGDYLDVVAPGVDISTTDLQGVLGYNAAGYGNYSDYSDANYTKTFDGTSAACPHVAGVAALLLSVRPDLTWSAVKEVIEATCTKLSGYSYSYTSAHSSGTWNNEVGHGLVNAYAALNYVTGGAISGPNVVCTSGSTFTLNNGPTGVPITWQVTGPFTVSGNGTSATVTRTGTSTSSGTLTARNSNNWIVLATKNITPCTSSGGSSASSYPNPVSDILTIEIDAAAGAQRQSASTTTPDYDLRLYDTQGTLLRNAKTKGGTVQFNVQNLPDGIYYLHIYDGVNPKPEMQQIVVEH